MLYCLFYDLLCLSFSTTTTTTTNYNYNYNRMLSSTNAALFSWDEDRNVIEKGPFEFRVRDKLDAGVKATLFRKWRDALDIVVE